VLARTLDAVDDALVDLLGVELELELAVQRRGTDEGMDALLGRRPERLAGTIDVAVGGAGETADHAVLDDLGDLVDGVEVAFRRDREAGLDDVDAHRLEDLGDAELLVDGHRAARGLLAVAQGGIEDDDPLALSGIGYCGDYGTHDRQLALLVTSVLGRTPEHVRCSPGLRGR
jgi:hypothetical protein